MSADMDTRLTLWMSEPNRPAWQVAAAVFSVPAALTLFAAIILTIITAAPGMEEIKVLLTAVLAFSVVVLWIAGAAEFRSSMKMRAQRHWNDTHY